MTKAILNSHIQWQDILFPFWKHAPLWLRRILIWAGTAKFSVGVSVLCLNSQNQMLLLEHRFRNEIPWGFPGGWVDKGERLVEAALREVREETGLEPSNPTLIHATGNGSWMDVVYVCRVNDDTPVIQRSEILSYRWVSPTHIDVQLIPAQAEAIECFVGSFVK